MSTASQPHPAVQTSHPPSKPSSENLTKPDKKRRDRKDRPCDACRRRKSKCVINDGETVCAACRMHNQQCTYVEDPRPRKRRVDGDGQGQESAKKRQASDPKTSKDVTKIKREESEASSSSDASPGRWHYYGSHVGYTTELEPMLFDISRNAGAAPWSANYQKSDDRNAFLTFGDGDHQNPQAASLQAVEKLVGPNASPLLQHFQANISRSFPIIDPSSLPPPQRKNLHPALSCAIYTVAASSPGFISDKKRPVDVQALEDLALTLVNESLNKPTLSTIQAGLLLMQRSDIDSKTLNTQLVSATFELGLHLDCTSWQLSDEERGLRKRLAWAVYMQDVWCSLVHGRPSLISKAHWAVQDLEEEDFGTLEDSSEATVEERRRGLECFCQMVALTQILSNILDTFYTQRAIHDYDDAAENGTRLILERAKPIQMKLKEWFTELPKTLKLDNGQAPPIIGHLHLAYFATEITLHRCIIRSLSRPSSSTSQSSSGLGSGAGNNNNRPSPSSTTAAAAAAASGDHYLHFICRHAAKSRLISAMDFVNRLRSDHLTRFWYFPSKVNFALVATFGSLLLATSPCQEEADFYRARLGEYRWTLQVSAKNAGFLQFAIESLESSTDLLRGLPLKPKIEDLELEMGGRGGMMGVGQMPIPYLIPQTVNLDDDEDGEDGGGGGGRRGGQGEEEEEDDDEEDDDDEMMDATQPSLATMMMEPIHSSAFQGAQFAGGGGGGGGRMSYAGAGLPPTGRSVSGIGMGGMSSYSGWSNADMQMSTVTEDPTAGGGDPSFLYASGVNPGNIGGAGDVSSQQQQPTVLMGTGPFAGTPFQGLGARDWFDASHHGSPEVEGMYGMES